MTNIDLHTHSVYSDGTYTPAEIVNYAKEKGVSAVSLTDHDTIDGLHRYLHKEGTAYVESQNQPFSVVVKKIHDAGGVASLAHPGEYGLNDTETERLVRCPAEDGLDAIECIHPVHSFAYSQKIITLSKQYNLTLTGGSDFHGKNDAGTDLGMGGDRMLIPESFLAKLHIR